LCFITIFFTGVPSGEPHTGIHGSVTVASNVQEARGRRRRRRRRRPEERRERFEFPTGQHTAQARARDRVANMMMTTTGTRTIENRLGTVETDTVALSVINLCINTYMYIYIYMYIGSRGHVALAVDNYVERLRD